jgi:hypothetical protein
LTEKKEKGTILFLPAAGVEGAKEGRKMNITSCIWGKARVPLYQYAYKYGRCID